MAVILVFPDAAIASGRPLKETCDTNCNQDLRGVSCTLYFSVAHCSLLSSWVPVRMPDEILLLVDGAVENRLELRFADLAALPASQQVPDVACPTDELDDCANVKYLSHIELSVRRGRDTRPQNEEEHAKLHSPEGG